MSPAETRPMLTMRLVTFAAGVLFLAYAAYALSSGRVISTWGSTAHRPSVIYWVTTTAFVLLGAANLVAFGRSFLPR